MQQGNEFDIRIRGRRFDEPRQCRLRIGVLRDQLVALVRTAGKELGKAGGYRREGIRLVMEAEGCDADGLFLSWANWPTKQTSGSKLDEALVRVGRR